MTEKVALNTPHEDNGVEAKQPYSSPVLVRYGTIEEITEVKFGSVLDGVEQST